MQEGPCCASLGRSNHGLKSALFLMGSRLGTSWPNTSISMRAPNGDSLL